MPVLNFSLYDAANLRKKRGSAKKTLFFLLFSGKKENESCDSLK
jgi:hypothetical protein